jgi:FMN phosphatase YigB (HAD superfamily)
MHVSFDFWNTLFTSNPAFKAHRLQLFKNRTGASVEHIEHTFATIGHWHNNQVMLKDGLALTSPALCSLAFRILGAPYEDHSSLISDMEKLFLEYPPLPTNNSTVMEWKSRAVTVSILSNTTFISGAVIRSFLVSEQSKFDFMIFSDELGYGKPDARAFQKILLELQSTGGIAKDQEIVHVGDDPKFDSSPTGDIQSVLL